MSRYAHSHCQWCGDRPGGCLYCIEQLENLPEDKLFAIREMIDAGELHVVAIRHSAEVLVRQVNGRAGRARAVAAPQRPCSHHTWAHDGVMFKYRHCTRPGCNVRQKFVWLPDDANANGEWVDVPGTAAVPAAPAKPQRKPVRGMKGRGMKKVKQRA